MLKPKSQNRKMIVGVVVIVTLALVGLTMIQVGPANAEGNRLSLASQSATTGQAASTTGDVADSGIGGAIVKMVSALVIVILVAYAALYGLKKLMGRRYNGSNGSGALEVIQSTYVGPHKAVSLVRVGNRSVLVGVTDQQITTLTELDAEETEEFVGQNVQPARSENFGQLFSNATEKLKLIGLRKKQAALET